MVAHHLDPYSETVVDAAIKVHSRLGPGLLESSYRACLAHELRRRGMPVLSEVALPIEFDGLRVDTGYRIDLLVGNALVVELKAVSRILPVHEAQLLTYLKLSGCRVGLLMNFNVPLLKDGITRMVNGL